MPRSSGESARRTAVAGSGVAGLTAAHILGRAHRVTLYEADGRLGGHAHTRDLTSSDGRGHRVDSGFTVHNRRTTAAPTRTCCGSSTNSASPPRSRR